MVGGGAAGEVAGDDVGIGVTVQQIFERESEIKSFGLVTGFDVSQEEVFVVATGYLVSVILASKFDDERLERKNEGEVLLPTVNLLRMIHRLDFHAVLIERDAIAQMHVLPERKVETHTGVDHLTVVVCYCSVLHHRGIAVHV